jgi:hypothetical protein
MLAEPPSLKRNPFMQRCGFLRAGLIAPSSKNRDDHASLRARLGDFPVKQGKMRNAIRS